MIDFATCGVRFLGVEARPVHVEAHPAADFTIHGLAGEPARREARIRVASALRSVGFPRPEAVVTCAPLDAVKEASPLDLAIAVAVAGIRGATLDPELVARTLLAGELGLDGSLRPVRGGVAMARLAAAATPPLELVLAEANAQEVAPSAESLGVTVRGAQHLDEVLAHLAGGAPLVARDARDVKHKGCRDRGADPEPGGVNLVPRLQGVAREIVASFGDRLSVLMLGPPGSGKTMVARRLANLLPPLGRAAELEVATVRSVAGLFDPRALVARPFRAPHHTISIAGLLGGGPYGRPGECSLAHEGILFLDEVNELSRSVLEAVARALHDGYVELWRDRVAVRLPARFHLVGAANPCPCGYHGDRESANPRCRCPVASVARYRTRLLAGPIQWGRVVELGPIAPDEWSPAPRGKETVA